ncbi:glycosyl transferase family 41-domain-containing protein [Xylariaceae sp. FL0804]|nr:glycosyl transferase family 41-domain-containing protein [Xylariaceae sp. FL0804]
MLPLVQRHRAVQQSPPYVDSPTPFPHERPPDYVSFHHHAGTPAHPNAVFASASAHRAFPVRTSQPSASDSRSNGPRLSSSLTEPGEHHLRRKTPNGTIDAGYDGTPAQFASGPPPLKHMILPGSHPGPAAAATRFEYRSANQTPRLLPESWAYFRDHGARSDANLLPFGTSWQATPGAEFQPSLALDSAPNGSSTPYYPYNNGVRVPTALQPMYQQSPGPAVFNNGGLLPPPVWPEAANPASFHHIAFPGAPTYHSINYPPMPHLRSAHAPLSLASSSTDFRHLHDLPIQAPSQKLESLSLDSARYYAAGAPLHDNLSHARFREKALAQAHRSYVELLSYLHHTRKSRPSSTGHRSSSKMVIFPKLPKPMSRSGSTFSSKHARSAGVYADSIHADYSMGSQSGLSAGPHAQLPVKRPFYGNEMPNPAFYHMFHTNNSIASDSVDSSTGRVAAAPPSAARASVEMLTHLCEQSGWKWIDGMLLGGCLHYGLEHFEQSLEWFQRIVALDANHVEAISNVAASLYCLDRHDEAERHWLQAVRKRPSYLEAVEHLVGLLCASQRNTEAVDTVDFIQRSIRLPDVPRYHGADPQRYDEARRSHHQSIQPLVSSQYGPANSIVSDDEIASPGFGSSGYSIPGSENGRMIALIHAKGNMLYALKDINRASEAFEEAVLISTGKTLKCIHSLIHKIQSVLAPSGSQNPSSHGGTSVSPSGPLLLPPERARRTAQLVFAAQGELPGLSFVPDGVAKKSAISTTSNSLLSLAKIFQDAMSNGGSYPSLIRHPPGVGDILALYYLSLSLSESPSTANNVGILLASVQQPTPASAPPPQLIEIPGITPGSGLALALAYYNYGLSLDAKHVHLHTNLGSLLKDVGQLDLAIQMYERAVSCDGNFDIALTNLANAVKDRGRISDAIGYYRRAVKANPQFAEAVCGLLTALNSVCDWTGRGGVLLENGRHDRWHVDDEGKIRDARAEGVGSGLMKKVVDIVSKQLGETSHWGFGALRNGGLESMVSQLGRVAAVETQQGLDLEREMRAWVDRPWEGSRLLRLVERSTKATVRRWYQDKYVHAYSSPAGYPRVRLPASLAVPAAPTVLPFHTFTCPLTAKDIRMISQRNAARISCSTLRSTWLPDSVYPPPPPPKPQLNVGYVSSDFNNHPLAHLMQSVFGFHNPARTKAFCYATTASDWSPHRRQIEDEAPVFRDVSNWSAEKLVAQIVEDGIHILVNLNGYTRGARNEIFAARPAPIQMSFMGFAGTLGAEWCDYLLADTTAVPPSTLRPLRDNLGLKDVFRDEESSMAEDWVYSENIIFCRDTFFCCDHAQSCDANERGVTWEEEQQRRWKMRKELFPNIPDSAIILGNFNQLYKIDPSTFRTWLRILSNVPRAILWLLRFPELGESNLRRTAREWAGEDVAKRIMFTDVAPKQQHISRARVCDLFLDTPECNAHTTAADVLWSSTPLLTQPRYAYKMCSRMAASILKGALPRGPDGQQIARELIAADDEDYEVLATRLASGLNYRRVDGLPYCEGRGRLAEIRKTLFEAKWTCALFDTHRWVSDLESAYEEVWRRWVAGEGGDIYL